MLKAHSPETFASFLWNVHRCLHAKMDYMNFSSMHLKLERVHNRRERVHNFILQF